MRFLAPIGAMPTLTLLLPGSNAPLRETLGEADVILVGRAPDVARLVEEGVAPPAGRVRAVPVPATLVSANHLLAWSDGAVVHVRDLRSRNGTAVRVPSGARVTVESADVTIELAPDAPPPAHERPRSAGWSDEGDFPAAVAREVSRWLAGHRVAASAHARPRSEPNAGLFLPIPLTSSEALHLVESVPGATASVQWEGALEVIAAYVHEQQAALHAERGGDHGGDLVLTSAALREAHARVVDASGRGLPVILLGETGAGKGTLARCYHRHSDRRERPFEAVNCAEIDKHFARTRLFGAKRGAYTGCVTDVVGAVECAHGGTLFLDELVDLPLDVQGELLTFLDDQRYKRLGDAEWRQADVRVVCGTNGDLRQAVRLGRFRADLWYRLAGRTVSVPPLRERREDVAAYLQRRVLGENDGSVTAYEALVPEARRLAVHEHPWRGNFRELEGFVRRLPSGARPASISAEACREALGEGSLEVHLGAAVGPAGSTWRELAAVAADLYGRRNDGREPGRVLAVSGPSGAVIVKQHLPVENDLVKVYWHRDGTVASVPRSWLGLKSHGHDAVYSPTLRALVVTQVRRAPPTLFVLPWSDIERLPRSTAAPA